MLHTLKVNLVVFKCICKKCFYEFESYNLSEFVYGARIIYTKDRKYSALINFLEDDTYEQVKDILSEYIKKKNFSTKTKIEYFRKVLGLVCDPINGIELDTSSKIYCPNCLSIEIDRYDTNPRRFIEKEIPLVTHERWDKLNANEKRELLFTAFKKLEKQ